MEARLNLLAYCLKYNNDWNRVYAAIQSYEELTVDDEARAKNFTGNFVSFLDDNYPERLKQKFHPPFVLYYDGDISLLNKANEFKNDLIFLHGPNTFNIPTNRLVTITDDNKVDICGGLRVWFNCESTNIDRYGLVVGLCSTIVGTKEYPLNSRSWFLHYTVCNALAIGSEIYMKPTAGSSYNNKLIKEGCHLIDSYSDLVSYDETQSSLPF